MVTRTRANAAAEIRALMNEFVAAARACDTDRIAVRYAPEVRAFDAVTCLEFRGRDAYMQHWAQCMEYCPGPMIFDLDHLEIEVDEELALCHALCRCGAVDESGKENSSWMRVTMALRRIEGDWLVVHEHFSLPFDVMTGAMLSSLTPQPASAAKEK